MTTAQDFRDATKQIVAVTNSLIAEHALLPAEEAYLLASMNRLLAAYDSYKHRQPIAPAAAPAAAPAPAAPRPQLRLVA